MTLTRRRFLTISAVFAATTANARSHSWQGRAFGADISIAIRGPRALAMPALQDARQIISEVEQQFSLYDAASALSRLNRMGTLPAPDPMFLALMAACDQAHILTGGLFDPTIQPVWRAFADGHDPARALQLVGWDRVTFAPARIHIAPGQALTFNGIAQGYATDLIAAALTANGLTDTLVNIGEYRAMGGPWTLGLSDPAHGHLGTRTLTTGAIATSSATALSLGSEAHILHRSAKPQWSTVSVEAHTAALADSLSTALTLAPLQQIKALRDIEGVTRITLVDFGGDLITV